LTRFASSSASLLHAVGSSASAPEEADAVNSLQSAALPTWNNCETCQRTSVFLLLLRRKSTDFLQLYLACFQ
jgi:hypothetical protein